MSEQQHSSVEHLSALTKPPFRITLQLIDFLYLTHTFMFVYLLIQLSTEIAAAGRIKGLRGIIKDLVMTVWKGWTLNSTFQSPAYWDTSVLYSGFFLWLNVLLETLCETEKESLRRDNPRVFKVNSYQTHRTKLTASWAHSIWCEFRVKGLRVDPPPSPPSLLLLVIRVCEFVSCAKIVSLDMYSMVC